MPLISEDDQELLDPLSEEVANKLDHKGLMICRFKLKEFACNRAKKFILHMSPKLGDPSGTNEKTLARMTEFQMRLDYTHDLNTLVLEFVSIYGNKIVADDRSQAEQEARVLEAEKKQLEIFHVEMPEEQEDKKIDEAVMPGGLTLLHVAAQSGHIEEVKRLVEICGAKVNIRDNAKMTPKQRAEALGHVAVASYLSNFS